MRRLCLYISLFLVLSLIPFQTFASTFYAIWIISNTSGTSYTNLPITHLMDNSYLISSGVTLSSQLDVRVKDSTDNEMLFMPASDRSLFIAPSLNTGTSGTYTWSTGNTPSASFPIILGYNGYMVTDYDSSMELGTSFSIVIDGYFNTASVGGQVLFKDQSFIIYYPSASAIRAAILDSGNNEVVSVEISAAPGSYTLTVLGDGVDLSIDTGGSPVTTSIGSGVPIFDAMTYWNRYNAMPYINEIDYTVGGSGGSPQQASPAFIAYNNGKIYVPDYINGTGNVYVMSSTNMSTVDTYTQVGTGLIYPTSVAADATYMYLVWSDDNGLWLSKIQLSDLTEVDSVDLQGDLGVTLDNYINVEDADFIYGIGFIGHYELYKLAKADLSFVDSITLSDGQGWPSTFSYDGTYIYVDKVSEGADALIRVDLSSFTEDMDSIALFDPDSFSDRFQQRGLAVAQDADYVYTFGVDYDQTLEFPNNKDNPVIYKISKNTWDINAVYDLGTFAGYNIDDNDYWTMVIYGGVLYCSPGNIGKTDKVALITVSASNGNVLDSILYSESGDTGVASGLFNDGAYSYLAEYNNGYNIYEISGSSNLVIEHIGEYGVSGSATEIIKYKPNTMVINQAIADLDTGDGQQDASIVWGTNPSGIGSTWTFTGSGLGGDVFTPPATPVPTVIGPPGLPSPVPSNASMTGQPQYPAVHKAAESLDWTDQVMYGIIWLIVAIAMGFAAMIGTGSIWGFMGMFGVTLAAGASTMAIDWWVGLIPVLGILFIVFLFKRI